METRRFFDAWGFTNILFCLVVIGETAVLHHQSGIVDLLGLPLVLIAEAMTIMRAVRVLLMYFPEKRKVFGRIPKETKILRLGFSAYVLMEISLWSAAVAYGIPW